MKIAPFTKEVLNRINRQPSNGLNLNHKPSKMQIKINHKKGISKIKKDISNIAISANLHRLLALEKSTTWKNQLRCAKKKLSL